MKRFRRTAVALLALATAVMWGMAPGCAARHDAPARAGGEMRSQIPDPAPDAPGRPTQPISTAGDPCAERLHALCGPLLHYYAVNRRLPDRIEELREFDDHDPLVAFTCPVSGKPYVYDVAGLPRGNGKPGYLVLYDAAPSHSGLRWAVAIDPPRTPGDPLIPYVVAEPEALFHAGRR